MDAVVLMEAVRQPAVAAATPLPKKKRSGISPNAALIAGVATLLLALGIGVLIGRSGQKEVAQTAAAPQVIKVGGGGEEATASASEGKAATGGGKNANLKTQKQKKAAEQELESGAGAKEVLKPTNGVKLPEAKVQQGDKCETGTAGCKGGEFTGEFFE